MMNVCKVGNQTSSQDPQAVNSRIFVGNLNTFQVTKTDVEKVFQRYGRIAGISMHKGYAFVQFTSPFDARSACLGEDGRSISGQVIDVNMVSEPKPNHGQQKANSSALGNKGIGQKRTHGDSGIGEGEEAGQVIQTDLDGNYIHGGKQARTDKSGVGVDSSTPQRRSPLNLANLKTYDKPDTLICGNCKEMFRNIVDIINHKRHYCKLRFACKCSSSPASLALLKEGKLINETEDNDKGSTTFDPDGIGNKGSNSINDISLLCNTCSEAFKTPWDLMVHAQSAHSMHIFEYKNDDNNEDDESFSKENIGLNTNMTAANEIFNATINNYNNEVPIHQQQQSMIEQSFLPQSQQSTAVGDRSH